MEDMKSILKQIGWSDELIDKCLAQENRKIQQLSQAEYFTLSTQERDTTTLTVSINTPAISDGTHFNK